MTAEPPDTDPLVSQLLDTPLEDIISADDNLQRRSDRVEVLVDFYMLLSDFIDFIYSASGERRSLSDIEHETQKLWEVYSKTKEYIHKYGVSFQDEMFYEGLLISATKSMELVKRLRQVYEKDQMSKDEKMYEIELKGSKVGVNSICSDAWMVLVTVRGARNTHLEANLLYKWVIQDREAKKEYSGEKLFEKRYRRYWNMEGCEQESNTDGDADVNDMDQSKGVKRRSGAKRTMKSKKRKMGRRRKRPLDSIGHSEMDVEDNNKANNNNRDDPMDDANDESDDDYNSAESNYDDENDPDYVYEEESDDDDKR
ncbi:4221_t:CDS:1 [Paraglomus brasilianum]|uniref:4221_t:CDS:1 n=1 Tax=Paraglomus brasilianum TaxID=144538 RepID=A0A9N9FFU3_9GLOM|nr:4221_t:CDS:1 [Paraglomus brasilianum]